MQLEQMRPGGANEWHDMSKVLRDRIKLAAVDLITTRGYHAVTFREIAAEVNTTRANLHYHFGSKDKLIEEVLADYVTTTLQSYRVIFTSPKISLREKMDRVRDFLKGRFDRFNPDGRTSQPWSLSARLRSDWEALSPEMKSLMRHFTAENETSVRIGVALAVNSGELDETCPQEAVSLLLVNNILYAANITRDMQSFDRLRELWDATLGVVEAAYGKPDKRDSASAHEDAPSIDEKAHAKVETHK